MVSKYQDMVSMIYFCQRGLKGDISFNMLFLNSKLWSIHKPRGQIFVYFSPTLPLNNKAYVLMLIWLTPSPSSVHVVYGCPLLSRLKVGIKIITNGVQFESQVRPGLCLNIKIR